MLHGILSTLFLFLTADFVRFDAVVTPTPAVQKVAMASADQLDPTLCHLTVSSTGTSIYHYDCAGSCPLEEDVCAGLAVEGIFYCRCDETIVPGVCSGEFDSELQTPGVICYQAGCLTGETCSDNTGLDVPTRPACICVE